MGSCLTSGLLGFFFLKKRSFIVCALEIPLTACSAFSAVIRNKVDTANRITIPMQTTFCDAIVATHRVVNQILCPFSDFGVIASYDTLLISSSTVFHKIREERLRSMPCSQYFRVCLLREHKHHFQVCFFSIYFTYIYSCTKQFLLVLFSPHKAFITMGGSCEIVTNIPLKSTFAINNLYNPSHQYAFQDSPPRLPLEHHDLLSRNCCSTRRLNTVANT